MTTGLIACHSCGAKNTSHQEVCVCCGGSISTPTGRKATKKLPFSESLQHWTISFTEKRNVSSETSKAFQYLVAAGSILLTGPPLFNVLKERLGNHEIKPEWFLLFNAEVACYVLHMLDRTLAMPAFTSSRAKVMNSLVVTLCDAIGFMLEEMGYTQVSEEELANGIDGESFVSRVDEAIKQVARATGQQMPLNRGQPIPGFLALVVDGFREMCNKRQVEYGAIKEDWFVQIALRFSKHAAEALEVDDAAIWVHWALLAPDVFKELLPSLLTLAEIDP